MMDPLPPIVVDKESNAEFRETVDRAIVQNAQNERKEQKETRFAESERDILDDALELLHSAMSENNTIDGNVCAMAEELLGKEDRDSMLKAHRLLESSGAHLGLWSLGKKPHLPSVNDTLQQAKKNANPMPAWDNGAHA